MADATPNPTPLSYEVPSERDWPAWRLLRLAVILWTSLVLMRHGTYWARVLMKADALLLGLGIEVVILVVALAVATLTRVPTSRAVSTMRLLAIAYIAVILGAFAISFFTTRMPRPLLHIMWMLVSQVQLLVVPALCVADPTVARAPPS